MVVTSISVPAIIRLLQLQSQHWLDNNLQHSNWPFFLLQTVLFVKKEEKNHICYHDHWAGHEGNKLIMPTIVNTHLPKKSGTHLVIQNRIGLNPTTKIAGIDRVHRNKSQRILLLLHVWMGTTSHIQAPMTLWIVRGCVPVITFGQ